MQEIHVVHTLDPYSVDQFINVHEDDLDKEVEALQNAGYEVLDVYTV